MSKPRVALLGLGVMGGGMASRLLAAGFPLAVYNRNRVKADALAAAGARVGLSPRDAATGADIVVAMVADDEASRTVWLGDEGALAGIAPGALLIESSTLSVTWVRELAAAAIRAGAELIDAPVTGSRPQAANGELRFLVGGSPEALEKARPVLSAMGRDVVLIGPTGSGALMKLINNYMCGVQAIAFAEGLNLIERSGLDRDKAVDVLLNGAPGSPLVKTMAQRMLGQTYTPPNFNMRLMVKDLVYAQREGTRVGALLDSAAPALALFARAIGEGRSEQDFSSVVETLRQRG
jgi:3-hydroxyisobutyrate dehydrogenase